MDTASHDRRCWFGAFYGEEAPVTRDKDPCHPRWPVPEPVGEPFYEGRSPR
jgi:hypothetical protein